MATVYAVFDPNTGLYSRGFASSVQGWASPEKARTFTSVGHAKNHITKCNNLAIQCRRQAHPYPTGIQIVELQVQFVPVKVAATL